MTVLAVVLLSMLPGANPAAAAPDPVRGLLGPLTPAEQRLLDDAADGRLDRHSLLAALLVAGGVEDPGVITTYQRRSRDSVRQWQQTQAKGLTPIQRAQSLFEWMHANLLRGGYARQSSGLAAVFEGGRFNCVSASLLWIVLAHEAGLDVRGLEGSGHAMARLILPKTFVDVETTCPTWFRLEACADRDAARRAAGARDGQASHGPMREVDGPQLIALLYYNRGVDELEAGRYGEAVAANAKALMLDPASPRARDNLLATLNNWAIALGRSGQYGQALIHLQQGMALAPEFEPFSANYRHLTRQWNGGQ